MGDIRLPFSNSFSQLPSIVYTRMPAEPFVENPTLIHANPSLCDVIGLSKESLSHPQFASYFSGQLSLPGSDSLAMVYSGHQFGQWAGQLGDGRALLLGQVTTPAHGQWDIQLKGSGKTPYSRFGDGRAVLRSCIREYLCGEAIHGLGILTTRALCVVGTNQQVRRESWEPGAVLARVASSHIRFGHFEHFFYHYPGSDYGRALADYVIEHFFSELMDTPDRYRFWFHQVVVRTAALIAEWQAVGFCHGVMNTDNMSILGETIDYGPFGFMEGFDPHYICNHSDETGRYAYDQQPLIGLWNLQALAQALTSFISETDLREGLGEYWIHFLTTYEIKMAQKLGFEIVTDDVRSLIYDLLELMEADLADYPLVFRLLSESLLDTTRWVSLFKSTDAALGWLSRYHHEILKGGSSHEISTRLNLVNPKYILRNWVAEVAIREVEDKANYAILDDFLTIFHAPYDEDPQFERFANPAPEGFGEVCVSCSS